MSEQFDVAGPLAKYWRGFADELASQGYLPRPIACQLQLLAHVSRFMARERITLARFGDDEIGRFMAERRAGGFTDRRSDKALVPLLDYLRRLGAVPATAVAAPCGRAEEIIACYRTYLREERALVPYTVECYVRYARLALCRLGGEDCASLATLRAEAVIAYVAAECGCRGVAAAKQFANATRWFLRHLHACGLVERDYSVVVPGVAGWQQTAIPKGLPQGSVAAALSTFDRTSVTGKRDYALVYLLARLGLRAGEAASLAVDDIDWRRGTLFVRGKGHRDELLPLPADVGEVLADYLADGRQRRRDRRVFQRLHAPVGGITSAAVGPIVVHAFARAGFSGVTPHHLRHAAATELLRRGGSLAEIGQVLRHRSAASTAIYAKVDYDELRVFARPWPGDGTVSALSDELGRYLALRNALGHKLKLAGFLLASFVSFMEARGAETITTELALAWAMLPVDASAAWWAQRLSAVRGFARHLAAIDEATEVPPPRLIVATPPRAVPYPLSEDDIVRVAEAAGRLAPALRGLNYATLFSLLATTGMRVGEALALDEEDVVLGEGLIRVRHAKFGKARDIPVHASTVAALADYRARRDLLAPVLPGSFFVSQEGRRLSYESAQSAFADCVSAVGLRPISPRCRPRLHDLRRRFATEAVASLYRDGLDPRRQLPRLSTYLGHVDPAATYCYVAASPELLSQAADRLAAFLGDLP